MWRGRGGGESGVYGWPALTTARRKHRYRKQCGGNSPSEEQKCCPCSEQPQQKTSGRRTRGHRGGQFALRPVTGQRNTGTGRRVGDRSPQVRNTVPQRRRPTVVGQTRLLPCSSPDALSVTTETRRPSYQGAPTALPLADGNNRGTSQRVLVASRHTSSVGIGEPGRGMEAGSNGKDRTGQAATATGAGPSGRRAAPSAWCRRPAPRQKQKAYAGNAPARRVVKSK